MSQPLTLGCLLIAGECCSKGYIWLSGSQCNLDIWSSLEGLEILGVNFYLFIIILVIQTQKFGTTIYIYIYISRLSPFHWFWILNVLVSGLLVDPLKNQTSLDEAMLT